MLFRSIIDRLRGERCDDGNNVSNDGCTSNCQVETASVRPAAPELPPTTTEPPPVISDPPDTSVPQVTSTPPEAEPPVSPPAIPTFTPPVSPAVPSTTQTYIAPEPWVPVYESETHVTMGSLLTQDIPAPQDAVMHAAPTTPGTGPRTVLGISLGFAALYALRKRKWLRNIVKLVIR